MMLAEAAEAAEADRLRARARSRSQALSAWKTFDELATAAQAIR